MNSSVPAWLYLVYTTYGYFDLFMAHSTGGLVGIVYTHAHPVMRLILSSPWVDLYGDPKSYVPEWCQALIVRCLSYLYPSYSVSSDEGQFNMTTVGEFLYLWDTGQRLFHLHQKQLVIQRSTARHMRTILDWQSALRRG